MPGERPSLRELLRKEPWILLLLGLGLALLLWPSTDKAERESVETAAEQRLRETLGRMDGVGRVRVLLAEGEGRAGGYKGAVVVCEGAGSSAVRLRLVQAVSAFTGLGTDKIIVEKWSK